MTTCKYCSRPGTASVKLNGGKTTVAVCPQHLELARKAVKSKGDQKTITKGKTTGNPFAKKAGGGNPFPARDLTAPEDGLLLDLVSSRVYPGLERKPGGPDNWVEKAGGLPSYIERIAKHLHYEKGFTISRAIATAVNTVKRWALGGTVTKNGTTKRITPATQAKAAAAVAQWNAKKARARADFAMSDEVYIASLDLALTKDGRKSYKRQGKWGHGFVPLDAAARRSKAKGSPIALHRVTRLYGSAGDGAGVAGGLKTRHGQRKVTEQGKTRATTYKTTRQPILRSLSREDAARLSTADIRRLLKSGKQPPNVMKVLNEALRMKTRK